MNRLRGLTACAGLSLGLLAAPTLAAPPAVLDRVPDNAMVVVTMPSPDAFHKSMSALATAVDMPMPFGVKDLLSMGGVTGGVDTAKPLAMVVFAPSAEDLKKLEAAGADDDDDDDLDDVDAPDDDDDEDADEDADRPEPPAVLLLPITNYGELLAGFDAKPGAGAAGFDTVTTPMGKPAYLKDLGDGYAAIASQQATLETFTKAGAKGALKNRLGASGNQIAESADLITIVNMDVARPLFPMIKEHMKEHMAEAIEDSGMPGAAIGEIGGDNPVSQWISDTVVRDAKVLVTGVKMGTMGVSLDMGVAFEPNSYTSKVFTADGKAHDLLAKLPAQAFLFAGATDTSSPAAKQFFKDLAQKAKEAAPQRVEMPTKTLDLAQGQAVVVGPPMNGLLGGLLTSTVTYTQATDSAAYAKAEKEALLAMNGQEQPGLKIETAYTEDSTKIGDVSVDAWSVKLTPDEDGGMATQGLAVIFGPTGSPNGYTAEVPGGLYRTFAKNSDLMAKALNASKGQDTLDKNQLITQVGAQLPKSRVAEGYIGVKSILDMVLPFAAMAGVQVPADLIPENLPPVGAAVASNGGTAHLSLFIPAPVIKTAAALSMEFNEQMGGMGEMEEDDGEAPSDAGQPRF